MTLSWFTPHFVPAEVQAEVGVLWEHRVYQSIAHAVVRYRIDKALETLDLDLPPGLRPRAISLVGDVQASVVPRVNNWTLQQRGGMQRLAIHLQRPITGEVYALLELPWDRSLSTETVPLSGIRPVGVSLAGGFVAFLADGVNAEPMGELPGVAAEQLDFARAWMPSLGNQNRKRYATIRRQN